MSINLTLDGGYRKPWANGRFETMKIDDVPSGTGNELVTINAAGLLGKRSVGSLPGGGGDGIYGGSGILTTDTIVAGNAFDFRISNVTTMRVGADDVILLQPPTVVNTETNLLVRDSVTGEVHIREVSSLPGSADTNIYNSNGVITGGDRVLDGNGNSLAFDNVDVFNISATTVTLGTSPPDDPSVVRLLTYDALSDEVRTRLVSSLPGGDGNIYDNNGVLGGNRIVDGDNNTLSFTNLTECDIDSDIIRITPLPPTNNSLPQVLSRNPIGGRLEMVSSSSLPNIYNSNGTISTNRTVSGGGNSLSFNGIGTLTAGASSIILTNPPTLNNTAPILLMRNAGTGALEEREVSSLPGGAGLTTTFYTLLYNGQTGGVSGNVVFSRIGRNVTLYLPLMVITSFVSTAVTWAFTPAAAFPADLVPTTLQYCSAFFESANGSNDFRTVRMGVLASGNIVFANLNATNADFNGFAATIRMHPMAMSYIAVP